MKLEIELNGNRKSLIVETEGSLYKYLYESAMGDADVLEVERNVFSVLIGGRSFEARITPEGNQYDVMVGRRRYNLKLVDPRQSYSGTKLGTGPGVKDVAAPIPGKIVKLLVSPGQQVHIDQGLVVVEAMKMENEMKAPKDGRIIAVSVKEGDTVVAGQVLVTLE